MSWRSCGSFCCPWKFGRGAGPRNSRSGDPFKKPRNRAVADEHPCKILHEYLSLLPLVRNNLGEGPVDDSVAGSAQRAAGREFRFDVGPEDALIVIDMQNDFIPRGPFNEEGGRLGAPEGDIIAKPIADMMRHFNRRGGVVVATRDYHPCDHVSFVGHGGDLPAHCISGHVGSFLYKPIADAIEDCMAAAADRTLVAFKGFHEDIDSFSGLTYSAEDAERREKEAGLHALPKRAQKDLIRGDVHPEVFTGCMLLKCSGMNVEGRCDANAPPDILAAAGGGSKLEATLRKAGVRRIFVCGLVTDFCVLDTTCNGSRLGFDETYMVVDAARPVYIPASDFFQAPYGSGFVQDPKAVKKKVLHYGAKFAFIQDILPEYGKHKGLDHAEACVPAESAMGLASFPLHLAPALLKHFEIVEIPGVLSSGAYKVVGNSALKSFGVPENGIMGPKSEVTLPAELRESFGIPDDATQYSWCYALDEAQVFQQNARFQWIIQDPTFAFLSFGGFAYFGRDGQVHALLAVVGAGESDCSIEFDDPKIMEGRLATNLSEHCISPASSRFRERGIQGIAWLGNGELECKHGGILCKMADGRFALHAVRA